jgi:hypothetical protein
MGKIFRTMVPVAPQEPRPQRWELEAGRLVCLSWLMGLLLAGTLWGLNIMRPAQIEAESRPTQYDVEAAYLYNFGKFIRWPETASHGPMQICVAGTDPFGPRLARVVLGETIDGRPLVVKRIDKLQDAQACSILFVNGEDQERRLLGALAGHPVLTVGESADFLDHGGVIQFVVVGDRVRFAVNLTAAAHDGLSLSSELLKVAVRVIGSPDAGGSQ